MARGEEIRIDGTGNGEIMFVPAMEPYCVKIMSAVFRSIGYDARVLKETDHTLSVGLKHTGGGECIPCPLTTGAVIAAIEEMDVPPEKAILFMPTACGPCRFGQYAKLNEIIFRKKGWKGIRIMSPSAENAYEGLPQGARMRLWHGLLLGDIFRKLACKIRPYEVTPGQTDEIIDRQMDRLARVFEGTDISSAGKLLGEAVAELQKVERREEKRPLVGIVGEIYVRSDPYINNNLIRRIEELGGEAWLAPFSEWIFYTIQIRHLMAKQKGLSVGSIYEKAIAWLESNFFFEKWEHHYYQIADSLLHDRHEYPIKEVMAAGEKYLPWQFEGESVLTLGRAELFATRDGAKAIVNASPMFCMPGTVTTSIFPVLEKALNVPIICNFYDGSGDPNKSLAPVMHYLVEQSRTVSV